MENLNKETTNKGRESFIFYKSFHDALKLISSNKEYRKVVETMLDYAIYDKTADVNEFSNESKMALMLISPQLKINKIRYENGTKPKRKNNQTIS